MEDVNKQKGIMAELYNAFEPAFSQETLNVFQEYINLNKNISKWMIFSDFCFGDKNKPNDVISFVFVPYVTTFDNLENLAKRYLPTDLKHVKSNQIGLVFLNCKLFFSLSILLDKKRQLLQASQSISRKDRYLAVIRNSITQFKGSSLENKLRKMERLNNIKLVDNIILTAFFAAYCANLLIRSIEKIEKIGWFPDRDNIVGAYNQVIYDLSHKALSEFIHKPLDRIFNFGYPESRGSVMWYDGLNRLPDYLAGTLADYNLSANLCSHEKHAKILKDVFAVNHFHMVLGMHFNNGMRFTRIAINRNR